MNIEFEPTKSFCYRFARYELLDEIAKEPEAISGGRNLGGQLRGT